MSKPLNGLNRREALRILGLGALGTPCCGWLPALAQQVAQHPRRRRHLILLWMNGGPSQTDTFDMKPGHHNGGEFQEIATAVPGLRMSEHLPQLAKHAQQLAIVRSLTTKEGDHSRGTHLVRTGHPPAGGVAYPSIASSLAKQLAQEGNLLPNYVSVAPQPAINPAAFGPGFLGPRYAPAVVGGDAAGPPVGGGNAGESVADLRLEHIDPHAGVSGERARRRMGLWKDLQSRFLDNRHGAAYAAHDGLYRKAAEMIRPEVRAAFDLSQETDAVRRRYGPGMFGQGCLLARRLVERGAPVVEVGLGQGLAWDTHQDNFARVKALSGELDAGWATLMSELNDRGLLESTTILWISEFGRTPVINSMGGRDHFPNAWSCVMAGGGIAGGQAYGRTSPDGGAIEEDPVQIGDVLATVCSALGVPPYEENITPEDRPIKIAEGMPIEQLLA